MKAPRATDAPSVFTGVHLLSVLPAEATRLNLDVWIPALTAPWFGCDPLALARLFAAPLFSEWGAGACVLSVVEICRESRRRAASPVGKTEVLLSSSRFALASHPQAQKRPLLKPSYSV